MLQGSGYLPGFGAGLASGTPAAAFAEGTAGSDERGGYIPISLSLLHLQPVFQAQHFSHALRADPALAYRPAPLPCSAAVVVRASAESRRAVLGGLVAGVAALTASSAQVSRAQGSWRTWSRPRHMPRLLP